jgi:hypothetical protein
VRPVVVEIADPDCDRLASVGKAEKERLVQEFVAPSICASAVNCSPVPVISTIFRPSESALAADASETTQRRGSDYQIYRRLSPHASEAAYSGAAYRLGSNMYPCSVRNCRRPAGYGSLTFLSSGHFAMGAWIEQVSGSNIDSFLL